MPNLSLQSFSVVIATLPKSTSKARQHFSETLFFDLLKQPEPLLAVLREGLLALDAFAMTDEQIPAVAETVAAVYQKAVL
jgi:hypothetical protein